MGGIYEAVASIPAADMASLILSRALLRLSPAPSRASRSANTTLPSTSIFTVTVPSWVAPLNP